MTTPQNPNVDQENEHGANLSSSGDHNIIIGHEIIHLYVSPPKNQPYSLPVSKSLRERYNDLPSDEDRARFRALGVLPTNLRFDTNILAALWEVLPSHVDAHVAMLEAESFLVTISPGLYQHDLRSSRYANGWLHQSGCETELKLYFARYDMGLREWAFKWAGYRYYQAEVIILSH